VSAGVQHRLVQQQLRVTAFRSQLREMLSNVMKSCDRLVELKSHRPFECTQQTLVAVAELGGSMSFRHRVAILQPRLPANPGFAASPSKLILCSPERPRHLVGL